MNANHVFRRLTELEADRCGVTYEEIVAAEVGTSLGRVLLHYDVPTAWRGYRANLRRARTRRTAPPEPSGTPPF